MIPVIDLNYDVNDAGTDNIHVEIPVIDRNYDINDIVTANLTKSRELSDNPGHSLGLQYKTLINLLILVNDWKYDVNDAGTANIHVTGIMT